MLTFTVTWHPSSVCRKLFKFRFSPLKLFGKMKTNFPGMMVRMASTKIPVCFDRMKTKKHDRNRHYCFWLVNIQKISSLKLWCQSELNLTPMMFGKSSTKSHFILIGQETHKKIILVKVFFQDFVLIDWKSGLKYTVWLNLKKKHFRFKMVPNCS